jgi:hypothetical protein
MGRRVIVAAAAALLALSSVPAHGAAVNDGDFARGPLDLKRLVATKHDATAPLHLRLVTYGDWEARFLDVAGGNRIFFLFNPDRSGRPDFSGEVLFRDGRLWMRIEDAGGDFVRRIRVYHPEKNVVTTVVPRGLPNPDGHAWLAASERFQTDSGPCAEGCFDRIPDHGWLKVTPGT